MANEHNLKPIRSASEAREKGSKGGKASGEARRRKANFRKTLNMLLTAEVEIDGLSDFLRGCGCDSTYEAAVNMAMIQKAMNGNVKAYEAIRATIGQTVKSDDEIHNIKADTELKRARTNAENAKANQQSDGDDGVEIINDTQKASEDIGHSDPEVSADI